MTLVLSTDVKCADMRGTSVTVGRLGEIETKAATTSSTFCDPSSGDLGALVIVPSSGNRDEVAMKIVAGVGRDADSCVPPYGKGCIVARRAVRYLPHTPLRISVPLRAVCDGVACADTQTCVSGKCVGAEIADPGACSGASGCGEEVAGAAVDGGSAPIDAAILDAAVDAATQLDASSDGGPGPDSGLLPIAAPCDASAQCASACCCMEAAPTTVCDVAIPCGVEAVGCLP
jgi:hypothetical protein